MDADQPRTSDLVDSTDCLEAVGVFRFWKNVLFFVLFLCLLLQLGAFLATNFGWVKTEDKTRPETLPAAQAAETEKTVELVKAAVEVPEEIMEAAKQVTADANAPAKPAGQQPEQPPQPSQTETDQQQTKLRFRPSFKYLAFGIRFINFVLIPSALLYCLTMLFIIKVSLHGRLGGINHISRAFFISMFFVIFLLPWQLLFKPVFAGVMFTPGELLTACTAEKGIWATGFFYLRFIGYWLFVLLLLILAQIRSIRWTRATLRRLEVI